MLSMDRSEHTNTVPSFMANAPYSPSGSKKQLVCPYLQCAGDNDTTTTQGVNTSPVHSQVSTHADQERVTQDRTYMVSGRRVAATR